MPPHRSGRSRSAGSRASLPADPLRAPQPLPPFLRQPGFDGLQVLPRTAIAVVQLPAPLVGFQHPAQRRAGRRCATAGATDDPICRAFHPDEDTTGRTAANNGNPAGYIQDARPASRFEAGRALVDLSDIRFRIRWISCQTTRAALSRLREARSRRASRMASRSRCAWRIRSRDISSTSKCMV